jgi:hypothetical protein
MKKHFQKILLALLTVSQIGILGSLVISPSTGQNSVGVGALRTATGSVVGTPCGFAVTMNDYSFFPGITVSAGTTHNVISQVVADPSDTVGRYHTGTAATDSCTNRWRYITASNNPIIWTLSNKLTGELKVVWVSDDPCIKDNENIPCLASSDITLEIKKYKSNDLSAPSFTAKTRSDADRRILKLGYPLNSNVEYRRLQEKASDDAPAKWILDNMKVNISDGKIICKTVC